MNLKDIAGKIAGVAPMLATILGGPAAGAGVAMLSRALGVKPDADSVSAALDADPGALEKIKALEIQEAVQLQTLMVQSESNRLAADTARIGTVNETMRTEIANRRGWWRDLFGYISALMFALEVSTSVYVLIWHPENTSSCVLLIGALNMLWAVPMAVLGISAWHDGATQRIKAGDTSMSAALAAKWGGS